VVGLPVQAVVDVILRITGENVTIRHFHDGDRGVTEECGWTFKKAVELKLNNYEYRNYVTRCMEGRAGTPFSDTTSSAFSRR
jgi:hypothetical protein